MSTIAAARAARAAREAVRADPEQPVHRVPVPARRRAAGRRRDDRAVHGRARPTGSSRSASSPPTTSRRLAPGAPRHGHAPRHRRRAVLAGRPRPARRDPHAGSACRSTRSSRSRCGGSSTATASTRCSTRPRACATGRHVHIVIGGIGPGARRDRGGASERDGLDNVHLVGFIPDADLPDYYRAADVFVLPTRTAEGLRPRAHGSGRESGVAVDRDRLRCAARDRRRRRSPASSSPPGAPDELAAAIARLHDSPDAARGDEPGRAREVGRVHVGPLDRHARAHPRRSGREARRWSSDGRPHGPCSSTRAGSGSAGRVASPSSCCRDCTSSNPPGSWVVWGPDAVDPLLWPGATRIANRHHPEGALQPARVSRAPRSARPAWRTTRITCARRWKLAPVEVTTVHDTIPFRYPPSRTLAPLMRRVHRVDGAPLDARRHRLRVLQAEPAGRPRPRSRPHRRC